MVNSFPLTCALLLPTERRSKKFTEKLQKEKSRSVSASEVRDKAYARVVEGHALAVSKKMQLCKEKIEAAMRRRFDHAPIVAAMEAVIARGLTRDA